MPIKESKLKAFQDFRDVLSMYNIKTKEELILIADERYDIHSVLIEHFKKNCWGYTELKTYDGHYCLKDYPTVGMYTFLYQERGLVRRENKCFSSYSACLVYGIFLDKDFLSVL
ncbi:hypothetical protein ACMUMQ_06475 [Marinomonas sp. 2405UD66-6]|uniref:hypothetical protein n=1 Tax=Marinomonas sp. 2405UD66-6 TaxID=3391834 RepID=UPI0039C9B01E